MNAALQRFAIELRRLLALSAFQRRPTVAQHAEAVGDRSSASDLRQSPIRVQRDIGAAGLERSVAGAWDGSAPPITLVGMTVNGLEGWVPHAQVPASLRQRTGA
jgi:2-keto-3-deoxy-galactonokinase